MVMVEFQDVDTSLYPQFSLGENESDDEVERLLSKKLMEGYILMEKACPSCLTPLVKSGEIINTGEDMEAELKSDLIDPPLMISTETCDGNSCEGVPLCVTCNEYVVSGQLELKAIQMIKSEKMMPKTDNNDEDKEENSDTDLPTEVMGKEQITSIGNNKTYGTNRDENNASDSDRDGISENDRNELDGLEESNRIGETEVKINHMNVKGTVNSSLDENLDIDHAKNTDKNETTIISSENNKTNGSSGNNSSTGDDESNDINDTEENFTMVNDNKTSDDTEVKINHMNVKGTTNSSLGENLDIDHAKNTDKIETNITSSENNKTNESLGNNSSTGDDESNDINNFTMVNDNKTRDPVFELENGDVTSSEVTCNTTAKSVVNDTTNSEESSNLAKDVSKEDRTEEKVYEEVTVEGILGEYNYRREIATKVLAEKMLQGYALKESQCEPCGMPLMQYEESTECVVCPVLMEKAKEKIGDGESIIDCEEQIEKRIYNSIHSVVEEKENNSALKDIEVKVETEQRASDLVESKEEENKNTVKASLEDMEVGVKLDVETRNSSIERFVDNKDKIERTEKDKKNTKERSSKNIEVQADLTEENVSPTVKEIVVDVEEKKNKVEKLSSDEKENAKYALKELIEKQREVEEGDKEGGSSGLDVGENKKISASSEENSSLVKEKEGGISKTEENSSDSVVKVTGSSEFISESSPTNLAMVDERFTELEAKESMLLEEARTAMNAQERNQYTQRSEEIRNRQLQLIAEIKRLENMERLCLSNDLDFKSVADKMLADLALSQERKRLREKSAWQIEIQAQETRRLKAEMEAKRVADEKRNEEDARFIQMLEEEAAKKAKDAEEALRKANEAIQKVQSARRDILAQSIAHAEADVVAEAEAHCKAEHEDVKVDIILPTPSDEMRERWETLRYEGRLAMTRRLLKGWKVSYKFCKGSECHSSPIITDGKKELCVVCGGSGNGLDGAYAKSNGEELGIIGESVYTTEVAKSDIEDVNDIFHAANPADEKETVAADQANAIATRKQMADEGATQENHTVIREGGEIQDARDDFEEKTGNTTTDMKSYEEKLQEVDSLVKEKNPIRDIHDDFEEKNKIVCKEIGKKMFEGWVLLDESCPQCDLPLLVDKEGVNEVCETCGVIRKHDVANAEIIKDQASVDKPAEHEKEIRVTTTQTEAVLTETIKIEDEAVATTSSISNVDIAMEQAKEETTPIIVTKEEKQPKVAEKITKQASASHIPLAIPKGFDISNDDMFRELIKEAKKAKKEQAKAEKLKERNGFTGCDEERSKAVDKLPKKLKSLAVDTNLREDAGKETKTEIMPSVPTQNLFGSRPPVSGKSPSARNRPRVTPESYLRNRGTRTVGMRKTISSLSPRTSPSSDSRLPPRFPQTISASSPHSTTASPLLKKITTSKQTGYSLPKTIQSPNSVSEAGNDDDKSIRSVDSGTVSVASMTYDAIMSQIDDAKAKLSTRAMTKDDIEKQVEMADLIRKLASAAAAVRKLEDM